MNKVYIINITSDVLNTDGRTENFKLETSQAYL